VRVRQKLRLDQAFWRTKEWEFSEDFSQGVTPPIRPPAGGGQEDGSLSLTSACAEDVILPGSEFPVNPVRAEAF